jgi:FAD/FMN-containing dehydrogenase
MKKRKDTKPHCSSQGDDLHVDIDWGSTGIWIEGANLSRYSDLDIPDWLVERFRYWTGWYNSHAPWNGETLDHELFDAYAMSLAVDLKRVVGHRHRIFYLKKQIVLVDENKVRQSIPVET